MKRLAILLVIVVVSQGLVSAQSSDDCEGTINEIMSSVTAQCATMQPDSACYGYGQIDAVANCESAPDFRAPGDVLPLEVICSLTLGDQPGVAMTRLHSEDPIQDITAVLFGEASLLNAGSKASELEVRIDSEAQVRSGPGSQFEIVGTLAVGDVVRVNACNCTGNWFRTILSDGHVGWLPAARATIMADQTDLPVVTADMPVYKPMQAFTLLTQPTTTACERMPEAGALLQATSAQEGMAQIQVNGVQIAFDSTIFLTSQPSAEFAVQIVDGSSGITVDDFALVVPAGTRVLIPMDENNNPAGQPALEAYGPEDTLRLPLQLLPEEVDPLAPLTQETPQIVGVAACSVVSDRGETTCPLYFMNHDGDAISRMAVEFVYASEGEWEGSVRESPEIVAGNNISGALAWKGSCSLKGSNFIGPVVWSITITDEKGHISEPFEASFNCVDG